MKLRNYERQRYGEGLKIIPPSNNTVMQCIEWMWDDIQEQLLTRIKSSREFSVQIDRCCRISSTTWICQILFRRKHPVRFPVLSTAFREMFRKWQIHDREWIFHSRRYFLGKLRRHLYRRSSSFDKTEERLSNWSTTNWSPRELLHYITLISVIYLISSTD
jgi:hypothetical protein